MDLEELKDNQDMTGSDGTGILQAGDTEVIQNVPDEFPQTDENDMDMAHLYKTQQIADKLGVQRQTVINYARFFEEILDIQKTSNGDRMYSDKCLSQLAFILDDKARSGRSNQQELAYLKSEYGSKSMEIATNGVEGLSKLFNEMQSSLLHAIEETQERNKREILSALEKKSQMLEDTHSSAAEYEAKLDEQARRYSDALQKRDDEIDTLQKELRSLKDELEEQKKPFWKRKKK